ncbi:MAG TPA: hypothetical protein ENG39_00610 [Candidatus Omnitrophica bacterium]|nr:hypothetical protein [Candidatus Omnitrophota bacterium]
MKVRILKFVGILIILAVIAVALRVLFQAYDDVVGSTSKKARPKVGVKKISQLVDKISGMDRDRRVEMAKRVQFRGTTKPIGQLLEEHPQVISVEWQRMDVYGPDVVMAEVLFKAKAIEVDYANMSIGRSDRARRGYIFIKVGENSALLMSIESESWAKSRKIVKCADSDFFFKTLEQKGNLAYGFWGMDEQYLMMAVAYYGYGMDLGL